MNGGTTTASHQTSAGLMHARHGFSMTELVVSLAVIGVISSIAVTNMGGSYGVSKEIIAREKLELLNSAVHRHNFANRPFTPYEPTLSTSASDEVQIVQTLTNPDLGSVGAPYIYSTYKPQPSSVTDDYRITWTGRVFKLLEPGQSGTGLEVPFDGSDTITP